MNSKKKIGFSVIDMVILVLTAVCILSVCFRDQLRSFLGKEVGETVEITVLIENVTEEGKNHPLAGEEIILSKTGTVLGTITNITENTTVYQNTVSPDDTVEIMTLTCKVQARAVASESGYTVSSVSVKPGATLSAQTESASFVVMIAMIKPADSADL